MKQYDPANILVREKIINCETPKIVIKSENSNAREQYLEMR